MAHNSNSIIDQRSMEDFFRSHLDLFPGATGLLGLKISPHDQRFVLDKNATLAEYSVTFATKAGEHQLILRGSTDIGEKRKKHFHVLRALWSGSFGSGRNIVARPIGYFPELKLLLYENVPGQSLYDKFQFKPQAEWQERLEQAIDWLVAFHSKKPLQLPETAFDWTEEQQRFDALAKTLIERFPQDALHLQKAIDRMMRQERELLAPDTFHLTHGDFQPHNILFRDYPAQTIVIDFNDAMFYDELYDLSYFTTQVAFMLRNLHQFDAEKLVQKMTKRYAASRALQLDEIARKKIELFRIKTLLHIKSVADHGVNQEIKNYADVQQ